jgi:hypothetical protein
MILINIVSFLTKRRIVILIDNWGQEYITLENKGKFNNYCRVYWITCVGHVILNKDNTCSGRSRYIKEWMYYYDK